MALIVWQQRNKYGAIRQSYNNYSYHSKKEAEYAAHLDLLLRAKAIKKWTRQVRIDLTAHGEHIAYYYVDFLVVHKDGTNEFIEVKGFETDVWKLKYKIFEAQMKKENPRTKLTIVY